MMHLGYATLLGSHVSIDPGKHRSRKRCLCCQAKDCRLKTGSSSTASSGALLSSNTTWLLVPPNPKEDKPEDDAPEAARSMVLSDGMKLGKFSKSQWGFKACAWQGGLIWGGDAIERGVASSTHVLKTSRNCKLLIQHHP